MAKSFLNSWATRTGEVVLVLAAAVLMVFSAVVHLHLWDNTYRHVASLGPLFLVQAVAALIGAALLAMTRLVLIMLGSVLLMVGTMVGFALGATVGLLGFTLPQVTVWADVAVGSELLSTVALIVVLAEQARAAGRIGPAVRGPA
ncbi:MAG TPA: hypothetical protein VG298_11875 [Acidimicrobiales bacterium]|jgi:hypothetical protein|nr:hypothetical protein [Acidimicrobiales bacterium]